MASNPARTRCRRREQQTHLAIEQLEQRSMLSVTAVFQSFLGLLTIGGDSSNDTIVVSRSLSGQLRVNGNDVANASVSNTNTISINGREGDDSITIDQTIGEFAPGKNVESTGLSEIEFIVDGQTGFDSITIIGKPTNDVINIGRTGINLNGDGDADVTLKNIESIRVQAGFGADVIRTAAGIDVGGTVGINVVMDGGDGDDILVASAGSSTSAGGNVTAIGGRGNDRYLFFGSESSDQILASFDAGAGEIVATVLPSFLASVQTHRISGFESIHLDSTDGDDLIDFSAIGSGDHIQAGITKLELNGGFGANTIRGSLGPDLIKSFGTDEVFGLGGNDKIISVGGRATLRGGSGDDRIVISGLQNFDTAVGGAGIDILEFTASVPDINPPASLSVRRDIVTNELILRRRETAGSNTPSEARATAFESLRIIGENQDDELDASLLSANDLTLLGISTVSLIGNGGNDLLIGTGGNDAIFGGPGNDTLLGLQGNDVLQGDEGNDELLGGPGNDVLKGGIGDDRLFGEDGNDILEGGGGNDFLDEGPGQGGILINGTSGNDVILVDRAVFNGLAHVITTINGFTTFQPYINGETIIVHAGSGNDVVILQASAWNNWQAIFHGGEGNDSLHGGLKNDQLYGEAGNDWLFGLTGDDILVGGDGDDWLYGHVGRDLMIGGNGTDRLFGGLDDDIVIGGRTAFDANAEALSALSTQWNSAASYVTRAASIIKGAGVRLKRGTTVFDDGRTDFLYGESGRDLFFADLADHHWDRSADEVLL